MAEHLRDRDPFPNGHPKDCNCAECELLYGSTDPEVIARENEIRKSLKGESFVCAMLNPWRLEYDDYAGYDCMTPGWRIYAPVSEFPVCVIDCGSRTAEAIEKARVVAQYIVDAVNAYGKSPLNPANSQVPTTRT